MTLTSPPAFDFPDFDVPFFVETDTSSRAVDVVMGQKQNGGVHPYPIREPLAQCSREELLYVQARSRRSDLRPSQVPPVVISGHGFDLLAHHQALYLPVR